MCKDNLNEPKSLNEEPLPSGDRSGLYMYISAELKKTICLNNEAYKFDTKFIPPKRGETNADVE